MCELRIRGIWLAICAYVAVTLLSQRFKCIRRLFIDMSSPWKTDKRVFLSCKRIKNFRNLRGLVPLLICFANGVALAQARHCGCNKRTGGDRSRACYVCFTTCVIKWITRNRVVACAVVSDSHQCRHRVGVRFSWKAWRVQKLCGLSLPAQCCHPLQLQ